MKYMIIILLLLPAMVYAQGDKPIEGWPDSLADTMQFILDKWAMELWRADSIYKVAPLITPTLKDDYRKSFLWIHICRQRELLLAGILINDTVDVGKKTTELDWINIAYKKGIDSLPAWNISDHIKPEEFYPERKE